MKKLFKIFLPLLSILLSGCSKDLPKEISQADWDSNRQYIELSTGLKMCYVEMGDPKGEPIILQHGMTDNTRSWSFAAPYFAKEGYHVYITDMRGQGKSSETEGPYSTLTYARDLNAFFEAKKIDNAICVGHSLGSFTMQTFWLLYPERVKKCVLVSSIPILGYQATSLQSIYDMVEALPEDGHMSDSFMDYWYDCSSEPVEDEIKGKEFDEFIKNMKLEAQCLSKNAWKNIIEGMILTDFHGTTDDYNLYSLFDKSKKCLILHGSTDTMTKGIYQTELINLLSNKNKDNITYKEYEGVGHNIQFVIPKRCSNDILSWLKTGSIPA